MGLPHGGWGVTRYKRQNDTCGHLERAHYAKGLCRECYRNTPEFAAARRAYYLDHKPQFIAHNKKRSINGRRAAKLYNLSPATYRRMVEAQAGLCYLCQQPPGRKGLGVDHDHKTGKVRSLLCARCNLGLGSLRDDAALCRRAADYLLMWS